MRIHLIAVGGSIMHNLAIALQKAGHIVSGSDDEIYEPARARLQMSGLLPQRMGWDANRISAELDLVILGMHARQDNPELHRALDLGLSVVSFPEFMAKYGAERQRVVVAGSHGKTTTTAMIVHALRALGRPFDFLVGAQLQGFDTMVTLDDAPVLVMEGDEYLSSCLDPVPKIWHYRPQVAVITGIAWDHMNVFPTFDSYVDAFRQFLLRMPYGATVFYYGDDPILEALMIEVSSRLTAVAYHALDSVVIDGRTHLRTDQGMLPISVFGRHNLSNMAAARAVLLHLGVSDDQFLSTIAGFSGAGRLLNLVSSTDHYRIFQDFAHAPSKVRATVEAVKGQYGSQRLTAVYELHTFSSLNPDFLPQYKGVLDRADRAAVFYSPHTLQMKRMAALNHQSLKEAFGRSDIEILAGQDELMAYLQGQDWLDCNLLLMSSGTFEGLDMRSLRLVRGF